MSGSGLMSALDAYMCQKQSLKKDAQKTPSYVVTQLIDCELGEPSKKYQIIHVAGTNGKGSVVAKVSKACAHAGLKVGVFTSPHLHSVRERIQINQQMISEIDLDIYVHKVLEIVHMHRLDVQFFEIMTAAALLYFADQKVDVAVLEVGIGGRYDSTNFVTPILSIITSISLDHTQLLGHTLDEIAAQKAGIIKQGVAVVLGPSAQQNTILQEACLKQAEVMISAETGNCFDEENQWIAKTALKYLKQYIHITDDAIEYGLQAIPPCRFEMMTLPSSQDVVFDVAHNPDGFAKLLQALKWRFGIRPLIFLMGMSRGKEIQESLKVLIPHVSYIYLAPIIHHQLLTPEELQQALQNIGFHACGFKHSLPDTWESALEQSIATKAVLVVCGSFYIMDEIKKLIH